MKHALKQPRLPIFSKNNASNGTLTTKIIDFMGTHPETFAREFEEAYSRASNRLIREFTIKYCKEDGSINWDALIEFNSGD